MKNNEEIVKIMDFILNKATPEELFIIEKAMERRKDDIKSGRHLLNLSQSAQKTSELIQGQFGSFSEIQAMAKNFITQMIRQTLPDIPEEHLNILLKEWLPSQEKVKTNNSSATGLPKDITLSMVVQFIDYSFGRMNPEEKVQLRPDWNKQYWAHFSPELRQLLALLLTGKITEKQFWLEYKKLQ
jgi:hypothetical protein